MSDIEIGEIESFLGNCWMAITPASVTMSLDALRAVIDKAEERTLTNQEFAAHLIVLQEQGKITYLFPDVVELHE